MVSNFYLWCQIVRFHQWCQNVCCVKLSFFTHGVKLSGVKVSLVSNCQIVKLSAVSNWAGVKLSPNPQQLGATMSQHSFPYLLWYKELPWDTWSWHQIFILQFWSKTEVLIKSFVNHNLGIRKQGLFAQFVTTLCITVTTNNKPVEKKVKVCFSCTVQDLLIPRKPAKRLLTGHCIGLWVLGFQKIWTIQSGATFSRMIADVQIIDTTVDFLPHVTIGGRQVKWFLQKA